MHTQARSTAVSRLNRIFVPGAAGTLEVVVHFPDTAPRAIAVVAHPLPTMGGTMENKIVTTLVRTFAELGFVALRFNFRGVGASGGEFDNGNGEMEDVITVARYALCEFGDLPLILSGFSFGGYVQTHAARQLHPQRMVLVAPAVGRFAPPAMPGTRMPGLPPDTLLIHGEQDEIVPLDDILQWAHLQHLPVVVVPETTHFFHGRLGELREIVRRNFIEHPL